MQQLLHGMQQLLLRDMQLAKLKLTVWARRSIIFLDEW
jgi:hypothetical protein